MHLLTFKKAPVLFRSQVLDQLRIRAALVRKAFQQLDLRIWPLDDPGLLQLFAHSLAPGSTVPTFVPALVDGQRGLSSHNPSYQKRLRGIHGTFYYTSHHPQARLEPDLLPVADLLAPSSIEVHPDMLVIGAGKQTRYVQTMTVTGYGHHLQCGWVNTLNDLGLPLLISTHLGASGESHDGHEAGTGTDQIGEQAPRRSDKEMLRITKADQNIEVKQIRRVMHALAAKKLKIFAVSMTITVHAGSRERLEQRSHYLLSHLRDLQIQARPATWQQDLAWQSGLPVGLDHLQQWVTLTSDVVSTMLPGTQVALLAHPRGSSWDIRAVVLRGDPSISTCGHCPIPM